MIVGMVNVELGGLMCIDNFGWGVEFEWLIGWLLVGFEVWFLDMVEVVVGIGRDVD